MNDVYGYVRVSSIEQNEDRQINRYRSDFGAQQNRLEHAIAVDDNTAENFSKC